jgi:hypothetical protein
LLLVCSRLLQGMHKIAHALPISRKVLDEEHIFCWGSKIIY